MTDLAQGGNMANSKNANHYMWDIMPKHLRDFYIACAFAALLAIAGFAFAFLR
jgi:hypothetical protein